MFAAVQAVEKSRAGWRNLVVSAVALIDSGLFPFVIARLIQQEG